MSAPSESEREAFKRAYQHCDLSEEPNATGELEFTAPYVAAAWNGWLTRSAIPERDPDAERSDAAKEWRRRRRIGMPQ